MVLVAVALTLIFHVWKTTYVLNDSLKNFCETQSSNDGYPLYRWWKSENGGISKMVRQYVVNNRWAFPYHPLLIKTFDAHINVDFCSSIKSIKYACKYVN